MLRSIVSEFISLFVDDGALALLAAILIAVVTGAVKLLDLPPFYGAMLVLVGSIAILADSLRRAARR
ncbi:MAG TPA: hypothetical protein VN229_19385 [Terriglobales bacterium]|nr:hypothetical protein [Terriglobales bacterium]